MNRVSLENLKVGDALPPLTLPATNRTTLALFAGASGDHNAIHIDSDFARRAGMPDVFAHGMLSMAYLGRMLTQWVDQSKLRHFSVRFVGITHLGHQITCSGRVVKKLEVNGEARVQLEIQTANQYGELRVVGDAQIAL